MASFTAAWTTGLNLHTSGTIANGASEQDDIVISGEGYYGIRGQVDIDIASGSPNGTVTIELFGSVDGGTSVDTVPSQKMLLTFTATGNQKQPFIFEGPWLRCKVTNNTGVTLTYVGRRAGLKQLSA